MVRCRCILFHFYIKPQQEAPASNRREGCILFHFYIKPQQLHYFKFIDMSCILFHFYIKPQHRSANVRYTFVVSYSISTSNHNILLLYIVFARVVSYSISTSNHNCGEWVERTSELYLIPFLHQTTTCCAQLLNKGRLYLIPFLHQTTTLVVYSKPL